jgi:CRISPR system Cascade subunit CasB
MTTTSSGSDTGPQTRFIEALKALDPADKARLKRNAGRTLSESRNALGLFYRVLPRNVPDSQHDTYFLLATLYPLADSSSDRNLGASVRRVRDTRTAGGLDRRMAAILDSDLAQLTFRLRQVVRLLHSHRVGVNWERLLRDLLQWNHADRWVQKAWAMAYYAGRDDQQAETRQEVGGVDHE